MTIAPSTLVALQNRLVTNLHTINLGIVGDAEHVATGGYHIGAKTLRANGMSNDYSLEFDIDRADTSDNACAIDIGGTPALLMEIGTRIVHALQAKDPRVYNKVRAVNAPFDGQSIDRRFDTEDPTVDTDSNCQVSSDRNHVHVEFYRTLVLSQDVMDGFYDVVAGIPPTPPEDDEMAWETLLTPAELQIAFGDPKHAPVTRGSLIVHLYHNVTAVGNAVKADIAIDTQDLAADKPPATP